MTVVYLLRTFPKLSESFVTRELAELARRGEPLMIWSMVPPDPGEPPPEAETAARFSGLVRRTPSGLSGAARLAAEAVAATVRAPRRTLPALGWCVRWAVHERDARHVAAFAYAAFIARRLPPDAHLHSHFANTPTTVAITVAQITGASVSFTGHAKDLFAVTSPAFLAEKVRRSTFVAVETRYAARRVRSLVTADEAARIIVIRNGLPLGSAGSRPREPDRGLVVSVGRLVPKKGHDLLIAAVAQLAERGLAVRCEILGDGPELARLQALVAERGVADRVMLRGAAGRTEVDAALARAAAFALPCRVAADGDEDGLPLAILEAMAASLPVVTTPIAGIPEVVTDGVSGLLVPPDDVDALSAALGRVLSDAGLRGLLGAGAREALGEFDLADNVDRLVAAFSGDHRLP